MWPKLSEKIGAYTLEEKLRANTSEAFFIAKKKKDEFFLQLFAPFEAGPKSSEKIAEFISFATELEWLSHTHLLSLKEVSFYKQTPFLAYEKKPGVSLKSYIANSQHGIIEVVEYLSQIAEALDYLHSKNIVYGCLNPASIIVDEQEKKAYLVGFGDYLSKKLQLAQIHDDTASYSSPERLLQNPLDATSDVFSFACIVFECLSGEKPFSGANIHTVISNILAGHRESLLDHVTGATFSLETEFERALSKDRSERFRSCTQFMKAIRAAFQLGSPEVKASMPEVDLNTTSTQRSVSQDEEMRYVSVDQYQNRSSFLPKFFGIACLLGLIFFGYRFYQDRSHLGSFNSKPKQDLASLPKSKVRFSLKNEAIDEQKLVKEKLSEVSDEKLLAILRSKTFPVEMTIQAIDEAKSRKLPEFNSALDLLLFHPEASVKQRAIIAVQELKLPGKLSALYQLLEDENLAIKLQAIAAIVHYNSPNSVKVLKSSLTREENLELRSALQSAIDKLPTPENLYSNQSNTSTLTIQCKGNQCS
ncbi:MAG: protein kinase [Deltaproteobacteria bacterium]|nr:protein kinase [Deltaproteobacteria bacterium]